MQELAFLSKVEVPTLVYGSQAEYNTEVLPGMGSASLWPSPPSIFGQLGSASKELYVDNQSGVSCAEAHSWLFSGTIRTFALGEPLHTVCSFLRRYLAQSGEAPPGRPITAKEWALQTEHAALQPSPPRTESSRYWASSWALSWRLSPETSVRSGKGSERRKPSSLLVDGAEGDRAARRTAPEEVGMNEVIG